MQPRRKRLAVNHSLTAYTLLPSCALGLKNMTFPGKLLATFLCRKGVSSLLRDAFKTKDIKRTQILPL